MNIVVPLQDQSQKLGYQGAPTQQQLLLNSQNSQQNSYRGSEKVNTSYINNSDVINKKPEMRQRRKSNFIEPVDLNVLEQLGNPKNRRKSYMAGIRRRDSSTGSNTSDILRNIRLTQEDSVSTPLQQEDGFHGNQQQLFSTPTTIHSSQSKKRGSRNSRQVNEIQRVVGLQQVQESNLENNATPMNNNLNGINQNQDFNQAIGAYQNNRQSLQQKRQSKVRKTTQIQNSNYDLINPDL